MKWYIALALVLAVGAGFYLHYLTFDPLTFVVMCVLLLNNHNLMKRQEETAELIKKSHEVTTANQKLLLDATKQVRTDLRGKL